MKFSFSKIIEKVSAVLSLDKWSFSFDFFLPFLWKDVDKLTCVVTETNYILASPYSILNILNRLMLHKLNLR